MSTEKKYLVIGIVIGLALAILYFQYFAPRYGVKEKGISIIKYDKWTGQSWRFVDNNWKKMADMDENWERIDKTLQGALKIPFANVDTTSALKKLRDKCPELKDIPDDELLERIKLVYSKQVLVNMYLSNFLDLTDQGKKREQ